MSRRIEADYLIETPGDPRTAAEAMAGEQSSGTFLPLLGETPELKARSSARVEALENEPSVSEPSLPGAKQSPSGDFQRAKVTLSWPLDNIGPSLPNLVATISGNLFELQQFSGLRILDVRMPDEFGAVYPGPKFGISGTRDLAGVATGPLIGTIVKPSIGLSAAATAELVATLVAADIDFLKDDELQSDGPGCPFDDRAQAVMAVINAHADRTGKKPMFAFNITGDLDEMRRRHDLILSLGGTCVLASLNSVGLVGMIELGRHSQLPIHAHRNGWGYLSRHPLLGWSYIAWQKLWRLAGADHMHVNGLANKFSEDDGSVIASAKACVTPLFDEKPCAAMPVFSSGQTVLQAAETLRRYGSTDLIYAAGGGLVGHPDGPSAGVVAMREAWAAAVANVDIDAHAQNHPPLKRALAAYRA